MRVTRRNHREYQRWLRALEMVAKRRPAQRNALNRRDPFMP